MFEAMEVFLPVLVAIVSGIIGLKAIMGFREWNRNHRQPVLTVEARIVTKRQHVSKEYHNDDDTTHHQLHTFYYATFEVQSGDRMEFRVSAQEYGMLAEGDVGSLTFQGKRYQGFERHYDRIHHHGKGEMLRAGSGS